MAKLVETENRLNHLTLHLSSYFQFRIKWIFRKLKIFCLLNPSEKKLERLKLIMLYTISKKILRKDVYSFTRKFEKLSKSRHICGCCNWKTHMTDQVISVTNTSQLSEIRFTKKVLCLSSMYYLQLKFFFRHCRKNFDGSILGTLHMTLSL